jgi:hypothetical protein
MELTEEMRCASMALAVSFASSADQRLVQRMRSSGTQWAYTDLREAMAFWPLGVSLPPISTYTAAGTGRITNGNASQKTAWQAHTQGYATRLVHANNTLLLPCTPALPKPWQ